MKYSLSVITDVIDSSRCVNPGDMSTVSTNCLKFTLLAFFCLYFSIDPFTRKDWYDIKAPSMFAVRQVGKTLVNRTQGTRKLTIIIVQWKFWCSKWLYSIIGIASEGLKGRVFEVSLTDLQNESDSERAFRKFKLISEDVQVSKLFVP